MGAYGTGLYGTTPYGGGPGADMTMVSALAVATSSVLVTMSEPPLAQSPTGVGDALNPQTWSVMTESGPSFPVVSVTPVLPAAEVVGAPQLPLQFQVNVYGSFPDYTNTLVVSAPTMLALDGSGIGTPFSATFSGVVSVQQSTPDQIASAQQLAPTDIANPPFNGVTGGGTLIIGPRGDYTTETGNALLKKKITRRLLTAVGGFYHLPDYGAGLGVKQTLPLGEAVKFQQRVQQQVLKEQGVQNANVAVSVQQGTVVFVNIQVQPTIGQNFSIGIVPGAQVNV